MDESNRIRRSVSFNLKPDVQLFIGKTPHSSPTLQSTPSLPVVSSLNLDSSEANSEQTNFIKTSELLPNKIQIQPLSGITCNSLESTFQEQKHAPLFLSIKPHVTKQELTPEEYIAVTLSPRSACKPNALSPRSLEEILSMRKYEQTCIQEAIHEATMVQNVL
jgi:hypothetical protein